MITRQTITHAYAPFGLQRTSSQGAIRITMHKGIPQTWAVARPTGGYDPNGAPFYVSGSARPNGPMARSGSQAIRPHRPNIAMDPSDPTTWQRDYRFT